MAGITSKLRKRTAGALARKARQNPKLLSIEGIVMLLSAVIIDVINIVLGILDFAIVGLILSPIVNFIAMVMIGGWLWFRTGRLPVKKVVLPFVGNSIPVSKFFPFWVYSVWTTLDKTDGSSAQPQNKQQVTAPAPAQ